MLASSHLQKEGMSEKEAEDLKKHATVENAQTVYEGAKWADKKCDELGIDKVAVAKSAGSALMTGLSFFATAASQQQ